MGAPATRAAAVRLFLAFAFAYFFSALLRAVTATLAPSFGAEIGLRAADLGLLAGAYFLGFASLQLPLGHALDRVGPKRVLLSLLAVAVAGCAAFALARSLAALIAARTLIGVGVAACLMAPLTAFRMRFSTAAQLRANSWMLMTGSLGMVASTLPVQWLLPLWGWRGLFWALAALLLLAMAAIAVTVPSDRPPPRSAGVPEAGYRAIVRHPIFVRSAPLGFFVYGGLIAIQALWAGPWLTRVAGWTPQEAAGGLFVVNVCMLLAFLGWGLVMPRLAARGVGVDRLMVRGLVLPMGVLAAIVLWPQPLGAGAWALWCVCTTFVTLSQPAVGQAFPAGQAGRALSAYNLVIFAGVFFIQWGIGLLIDGLMGAGLGEAAAFRAALAIFGACGAASWAWFAWSARSAWRGAAGQ
ncbi:MAG TPA: MFS transporter [Burkholderiaceae bacterium]|nr:MFS transporter [Burkholderiaceae bacterium]